MLQSRLQISTRYQAIESTKKQIQNV